MSRISSNLAFWREKITQVCCRYKPYLSKSGWATIDALVGALLSIAVAPLLVISFDSAGYGLWALGMAITGFGGLVSLGAGVSCTKYVADHLSVDRPDLAIQSVRAALTIVLVAGASLIALTALSAPMLAGYLFERMGDGREVALVLLLGGSLLALQEIDGVFTGALRGVQRFDLAAQVDVSLRVVWILVVIGTAWWYQDVLFTLGASNLVYVAKIFMKAYVARRILGNEIVIPTRRLESILIVVEFGKWVSLQTLGGLLFSVVDRLVVGAVFGASDLARYSICAQLAQAVHALHAVALQPIFPWVASRTTSREYRKGLRLLTIAALGGFACLIIPLVLIFVAEVVLDWWMGASFSEENFHLCRALLAGYALLAANVPFHYMLQGMGIVRTPAIVGLVAGVMILVASLLLAPNGLTSFALSKLLYAPVLCFYIFALWFAVSGRLRA